MKKKNNKLHTEMSNRKQKNNKSKTLLPLVSIITPTFNRRPFIPLIKECIMQQTYPKSRMEWVIVDDGTDKIGELVQYFANAGGVNVNYVALETKQTLGKKRNMANQLAKGDILVYMDDDDYYPPERIAHAVDMLQKNPSILIAGSSIMHIYFKHIGKMYRFGPYTQNHATAATFAFRKQLLDTCQFSEDSSIAEEKQFLKNYTIPMVQLDSLQTIMVFSHDQNSFDKKELLVNNQPTKVEVSVDIRTYIKNDFIYTFFMSDLDSHLSNYQLGNVEHKPDVVAQLKVIQQNRENREKQMLQMQNNKLTQENQQLQATIQQLTKIKDQWADKNKHLETHIQKILAEIIQLKKEKAAKSVEK